MSHPFVQPTDLIEARRPIFDTCYSVAVYTGMMEWIGLGGGYIRASDIAEAIYSVFLVQLDLAKDILNPDKSSAGEFGRACQISKARGVATSLLYGAVEATIDAG